MDLSTWFTRPATDRSVAWVNDHFVSEKDFFVDIERFRKAFKTQEISRIALFCQDTYRFACALFGAWQANVLTVLPTDMTELTQKRLCNDVDAFVFDEHCSSHYPTIVPSESLSEINFHAPLDQKAPLIELFTSGSTGEPLRIPKRLEQIFEGIDHLDAHFHLAAPKNAIVFSSVSHQHIYGFLWRLLWPLASGRIFTNERLFYPETLVEQLSQHQNCLFVTSPAHLQRLPSDLNWTQVRENLKMIVTSGGPLSLEGLSLCRNLFGLLPYEIFGSTELDGIAWRQRQFREDGSVEPNSEFWHPMPETEIDCSTEGLLLVRSNRLDKDAWTPGNDRITLLMDGRFQLLGRADRIVKVAEKRVSLTAMEQVLLDSGLIKECKAFIHDKAISVVAVPNELGQQTLSNMGKVALVKRLRKTLLEQFETVMLPHRWRFEPILPFDQRGKCTIEALKELFDPCHLQPSAWSLETQKVTLRLTIEAKNPYFKGHFPEFALLPGVAQIEYVVREAHRYLKTPLAVREGKNIKFMRMILPNQSVEMRLQFEVEKNSLNFVLYEPQHPEQKFSIGTLIFGD